MLSILTDTAVNTAAVATSSPPDWNIVAAAMATFIATGFIILRGWLEGRKKVVAQVAPPDSQYVGAIIQDNKSVMESTLIMRELRDQLLMTNHATGAQTLATEALASANEELVRELRHLRRMLEKATQSREEEDRRERERSEFRGQQS